MKKKSQPADNDISRTIGGTLNLFGLKLDLGSLLSSPEDVTSQLEGLRERLKDLGGKETMSDEGWKAGAASVSGYVRVRSLTGEEEYHIGTGASRRPRSKAEKTTEPPDVVEPPLDIFDEPDGVVVIADVPGVDLDDLTLTAEGKVLHISPKPTARRGYKKDIELGAAVDPQSLQATCRNGVLEIRLSKTSNHGD